MRQGQQNRRGRGRNNNNNGNTGNRKSQNPLTRSFESTGPDVKLRGTPSHVAEKYMSLARDALSSGDPVLAENYMQHAEHYNRIIMSFREQQISQGGGDPFAAGSGMGRPPRTIGPQDALDGDDFGDDEGDDFGGDAQGGVSPPEGGPQMPQPRSFDQPPQQRFDNNRPQHNNQNQQRNEHRPNQHQRHDRNDRNDNRFDRQDRGDRFERNDRGGPDRNQDRNQDRGPQNQDRNQDRGQQRHDRPDFNSDRSQQNSDRSGFRDRNGNANGGGEPHAFRDDRAGLQPQPQPQPTVQQHVQPAPAAQPPQPPAPQPQPQVTADGAAPESGASHRRRERFQNQIKPAATPEPAVAGPGIDAHQPDFLRRPVRRPRREDAPAAANRTPVTPVTDDKE